MQHPTRPAPRSPARLATFVLLFLVGVGWLALALTANAQKKEEEEQTPPAKTKQKGKEEEEEKTTTKPQPRPKVEEEDTSAKTAPRPRVPTPEEEGKKPPKASVGDIVDLVEAARKEKNPAVKEFLESVAVPHDLVVNARLIRPVAPVDKYLGQDPPRFTGSLDLRPLDDEWHEGRPWHVTSGMLTSISYYEQIAIKRVDEFLEQHLDRDPTRKTHVSRQDQLRLAEAVLASVQRFHESQAQQGKRDRDGFPDIEAALKKQLLAIQLEELDSFVAANDWDNAFALASRLSDAYPKPEDRERIATVLAKVIGEAARAGNYNDQQLLDLQGRLRQLEERFPNSAALIPINNRLKAEADALFQQAKDLVDKDKNRRQDALNMLRRAERVYPRLPGLHDYRLRLDNALAVLRVGVRDLPVNVSPNLACTDPEKQAVELLFEGLVKLAYDPSSDQYYAPGLADGQPLVLSLGRQFHLARDAYWSNDKPVTGADVRSTLKLLREPKWSGYNPLWKNFNVEARVDSDPARVTITFDQGVFDPLALMTFKVLPAEPWPNHPLTPDDEANFAQHPVGSGPYVLGEKGVLDGRPYVPFTASPSYGSRAGKAGLPHIREVDFVTGDDPVQDLLAGRVDLVTDVPTARLPDLQKAGSRLVVLPPQANRRIYFLAVNARLTGLREVSLRRAIAHAIDREKILDGVFRAGQKDVHKALNGPYPPGSWAWNPDPVLKYRPDVAHAAFKDAQQAAVADKSLGLKYPAGDPLVEKAMQMVRDQVKAELGMTLQLEALPPRELREEVEARHHYDLAYYHYDYPSEAFCLWPLFDAEATGPRQSNYLGYINDGALQQQFMALRTHRDPELVQADARQLHKVFFDRMPFIPLWQLDTHVAMSKAVEARPFDPLLVFTNIDEWRLEVK
jgi:ABC-type transport system substrate-binding protein